jgi:hypothetical protein
MLLSLLHAAAAADTAAAAAAAKAAAANAAACKFGLGLPSGPQQWHNSAAESIVVIIVPVNVAVVILFVLIVPIGANAMTTASKDNNAMLLHGWDCGVQPCQQQQPKPRGRSPSHEGAAQVCKGAAQLALAPSRCNIAIISAAAVLPTLPVSAAHCHCAIATAIAVPLLLPLLLPHDVPYFAAIATAAAAYFLLQRQQQPKPQGRSLPETARAQLKPQGCSPSHKGAAQGCKGASQAKPSCRLIVVFTAVQCPYLQRDVWGAVGSLAAPHTSMQP